MGLVQGVKNWAGYGIGNATQPLNKIANSVETFVTSTTYGVRFGIQTGIGCMVAGKRCFTSAGRCYLETNVYAKTLYMVSTVCSGGACVSFGVASACGFFAPNSLYVLQAAGEICNHGALVTSTAATATSSTGALCTCVEKGVAVLCRSIK